MCYMCMYSTFLRKLSFLLIFADAEKTDSDHSSLHVCKSAELHDDGWIEQLISTSCWVCTLSWCSSIAILMLTCYCPVSSIKFCCLLLFDFSYYGDIFFFAFAQFIFVILLRYDRWWLFIRILIMLSLILLFSCFYCSLVLYYSCFFFVLFIVVLCLLLSSSSSPYFDYAS